MTDNGRKVTCMRPDGRSAPVTDAEFADALIAIIGEMTVPEVLCVPGQINRKQVADFARQMARADAEACKLAGTEMSGDWSGEATTALADSLDIDWQSFRRQYPNRAEEIVAWAEEAYAAEAQRELRSEQNETNQEGNCNG